MKIDFALVNGNVSTLSNRDDTAEAIAVAGGRILSIGTTKSIEELLNKVFYRLEIRTGSSLPETLLSRFTVSSPVKDTPVK